MGRKTELTLEVIEKAKSYLGTCVDDFSDKDRKVVNLPSVAGLSVFLGYARSAVYTWAEENSEFGDILQDILSEQEKRLLNHGLAGNYNSNIVKLALGKHGYTDSVDHTTKGEKLESGVTPAQQAILQKYEDEMKKSLI